MVVLENSEHEGCLCEKCGNLMLWSYSDYSGYECTECRNCLYVEPCPFCGGKAELFTKKGRVKIKCSLCGAKIEEHSNSVEFFVNRWNKCKI